MRVEGLRQVAQGEGEVPRQVRVPVQAVLQSLGQDGVEHQRGQQLTGGLAAAQLSEGEDGGERVGARRREILLVVLGLHFQTNTASG